MKKSFSVAVLLPITSYLIALFASVGNCYWTSCSLNKNVKPCQQYELKFEINYPNNSSKESIYRPEDSGIGVVCISTGFEVSH